MSRSLFVFFNDTATTEIYTLSLHDALPILAREACGGAGYLQENRLPHLKADTDVFTTFEGDNTVLLQLVAKGLLTGYRDAFGSLDGWGKVGFIADMVRETVLERTADRKSTRLNSSHA